VYDFGLTEEQFLSLTPVKFRALSKRHEHKNQLQDYRAGVVASLLYNIYRGKSAAKGPDAFFNSLAQEENGQNTRDRGMTGQQMLVHMMNVTLNKPAGI
jgi:hypothetical protein